MDNKDKSIFNISIIEIVLVLFFMYMVITVYQLSFKDTHIQELEKTVESQRELTQEIVKKEYPKLENKIQDLVNLEKYKKLNNQLMRDNSGIYFVENRIIDNMKNADKLKDQNKYEELLKEKSKLHTQILNLQKNKLTLNTLNEMNIKNEPLHRQIQYLEKKVKDNYQNKLTLANKLKDLKTNETVKYILLKLNKYDAPIQEQLDAINYELKKFDKNLLPKNYNLVKNYNSNTNYVLKNIKQDNKPLESQIKVLKQTLENQKLIQKIKMLENQLANNQKAGEYSVDINNTQKALKNLQDIKNNTSGKYDTNTKDILREINQNSKPLDKQISELKKQLELAKNANELETKIKDLQRQLDQNKLKNPKITNENIQKALDNLQDIKNNTTGKYDPNTKDILNELNQNTKPLDKQISELKKQLALDNNKDLENKIKDLQRQLDQSKLKNPNITNENIQKALDNLQDIKNDTTGKYDPNTKEILKKLDQSNKPLDEQINKIKKELELAKKGKDLENQIKDLDKQIDKNLNIDNPDITSENIKNALDNLQNIKNNTTNNYDPKTKEIIKKLNQDDKPLGEQINNLKKQIELGKKAKDLENQIKDLQKQIADNKKQKEPNITNEDIQNALKNLQDIKNNKTTEYDPKTKEIIQKLNQIDSPLDERISELKKQQKNANEGKDLENKIKDLKKQIADNKEQRNPSITNEDIQKALGDLEKQIENNTTDNYDPKTKEILKELNQSDKPLDEQINNLIKEQKLGKKGKDLESKIADLQKQIADNKKQKEPNITNKDIQNALDNLQDIKNNKTTKYDPKTKEIIQKLNQSDKPLDEQITELKKQQELANEGKDLENKIKDLEKQIANNKEQRNPNINNEDIQKALDKLREIKANSKESAPDDKVYKYKLQDALDGLNEIQKIKDELANDKDYKPTINKDIEQTIKYLEDKSKQPNLKPNNSVQKNLDKFGIKGKPTADQLSDLYLNLYTKPEDNTNISELNFVINRLNDQNELEDRVERINEFLKDINRPRSDFLEEYVNGPQGKDTNDEIRTLKNQVKYLQKKIEKSGKLHLPCFLDDEGYTLYLFKLFLREDNIYVQLGWQDGVPELAKDVPNLDKLVEKTLSLDDFMKYTKAIFEQTVKDECRHFVYFEDETISKKEYKRKTLTIQHHFYKYIDHTW